MTQQHNMKHLLNISRIHTPVAAEACHPGANACVIQTRKRSCNGKQRKNNGFNKFPLRFNGKFLDRLQIVGLLELLWKLKIAAAAQRGQVAGENGLQVTSRSSLKMWSQKICAALLRIDWGFWYFRIFRVCFPWAIQPLKVLLPVPCWTLMLTLPRSEAVFTSFYNKPNLLSPSTSFCNFWLQLSILVQSLALQRRVAASQSELGLHLRAACFESSARCQWRLDWTMAW